MESDGEQPGWILPAMLHEAPPNLLHQLIEQIMMIHDSEDNGMEWHEMPFVRTVWSLREASKRTRDIVDAETTRISWLGGQPVPSYLPMLVSDNGASRWKNLVAIQCEGANLVSLKGVQSDQLKYLHIPGNCHLHSLAPLQGCSKLEELNICQTAVSNLAYISDARQLTRLLVDYCPIKDISVVTHLALTVLSFSYCKDISDLGPLSTCTNLESLSFIGLPMISDLSPLSSLVKLTNLECSECPSIDNIEPIKDCVGLTTIDIGSTSISDLTPLSKLLDLSQLVIDNTRVTSIEPLRALANLKKLTMKGASVASLDPILDLDQLHKVSCDSEPIIGVSSVAQIVGHLRHRIKDIRAVGLDGIHQRLEGDPDGNQAKSFVEIGAVQILISFVEDDKAEGLSLQSLQTLCLIADKGYRGFIGKSEGALHVLTQYLGKMRTKLDEAGDAFSECIYLLDKMQAATSLMSLLGENQDRDIQMASHPGLLQDLFDTWQRSVGWYQSFCNPSARLIMQDIISVFANLSYKAANRCKIAAIPNLLAKLVFVVTSSAYLHIQTQPAALEALANLTLCKKVCRQLIELSHLDLDSFVFILSISIPGIISEEESGQGDFAAQIICNLIAAKASRMAILMHPRLQTSLTHLHVVADMVPSTVSTYLISIFHKLSPSLANDKVKLRLLLILSAFANHSDLLVQLDIVNILIGLTLPAPQGRPRSHPGLLNVLVESEAEAEDVRLACASILDQIKSSGVVIRC